MSFAIARNSVKLLIIRALKQVALIDWRRISLDFFANRRIVSGRLSNWPGSDISDGWQDKRLRFCITP